METWIQYDSSSPILRYQSDGRKAKFHGNSQQHILPEMVSSTCPGRAYHILHSQYCLWGSVEILFAQPESSAAVLLVKGSFEVALCPTVTKAASVLPGDSTRPGSFPQSMASLISGIIRSSTSGINTLTCRSTSVCCCSLWPEVSPVCLTDASV